MNLFKVLSKTFAIATPVITMSIPFILPSFHFLKWRNLENAILEYIKSKKVVTIHELIYTFSIPFHKLFKILYKFLIRGLIEWKGVEIRYKG